MEKIQKKINTCKSPVNVRETRKPVREDKPRFERTHSRLAQPVTGYYAVGLGSFPLQSFHRSFKRLTKGRGDVTGPRCPVYLFDDDRPTAAAPCFRGVLSSFDDFWPRLSVSVTERRDPTRLISIVPQRGGWRAVGFNFEIHHIYSRS